MNPLGQARKPLPRWRSKAAGWRREIERWKHRHGVRSDRQLLQAFSKLQINASSFYRVLGGRLYPSKRIQQLLEQINRELWRRDIEVLEDGSRPISTGDEIDLRDSIVAHLRDPRLSPCKLRIISGRRTEHSATIHELCIDHLRSNTANELIFVYSDPEEEVLAQRTWLGADAVEIMKLFRRVDRQSIREFVDSMLSMVAREDWNSILGRISYRRFAYLPSKSWADKGGMGKALGSANLFNPFSTVFLFAGRDEHQLGLLYVSTGQASWWFELSTDNAAHVAQYVERFEQTEFCVSEHITPLHVMAFH